MLPSFSPKPLKTPSIASSWKDLSNDLKLKIIDSFARASKITSCKQVIRLCEDALYGEDEYTIEDRYKKLFLIQVNKLNWPPIQERSDKTLIIPNDQTSWKAAYEFECTRFNRALDAAKNLNWIYGFPVMYRPYVNNAELILALVNERGMALEFASPRLQDDEVTVLAAVNRNGRAFNCASPRLQDDQEIVRAAVQNYGLALESASPRWRDDRATVLAALNNNAYALEFASSRWKSDLKIVLAAVKNEAGAKKFAPPRVFNPRR